MKIRWWWGVVFLVSLSFPVRVYADENFAVDREVIYTINDDLVAGVQENYVIENLTTQFFPEEFVLQIAKTEIWNIFAQDENGQELQWKKEMSQEGEKEVSKIVINLPEPEIGKGQTTEFSVLYDLKDAVVDKGQIRELKLPKIMANPMQRNGSVKLRVKNSLGKPAYIVPDPKTNSETESWQEFGIAMENLKDTGLRAVFGNFQLFDFELKYLLKNEQSQNEEMELALPPDTTYQRIALTEVIPPPQTVRLDADGNWLAKYRVAKRGTKQIAVKGSAMVFAKPWRNNQEINEDVSLWTRKQPFWEIDNFKVKDISQTLSGPESIYDYVTGTLKYDYERLSDEATRKGAVQAIEEPEQSICMEFSDLFIALARTRGIPARQLVGYAYSDNPELRPISLVADVLHAWPEYLDAEDQSWKPVDPTWEVTTGGTDYFHTWDLNHLVLAINGASSERPLAAGFYKQPNSQEKAVTVTLGKRFPEKPEDWEVKLRFERKWWPYNQLSGHLVINNEGNTAINDLKIKLQDNSDTQVIEQELESVGVLPPYGIAEGKFVIQSREWLSARKAITVVVNGKSTEVRVPWWVGGGQLVILLVGGGVCGLIAVYVSRKSFKFT